MKYSGATHLFWKAAYKLGKRSGWLFLALYLKQAKVALQRFCVQDSKPDLTVYVSLTRSGIPRIIPSFHRNKIRKGDKAVIQLYMALFSLSKFIPLASKVKRSTFETITRPSDLDRVQIVTSQMRSFMPGLFQRYVPGIEKIPFNQGFSFQPTWKSIPTGTWYCSLLRKSGDSKGKSLKWIADKGSSIFTSLPYEMAAFRELMTFCHARGEQFSQGCLWMPFTRYAFDSFNKNITNISLEWFERRIGPYLPSPGDLKVPFIPGRLCASCTGDGKRRLFAIGNYINQRLLYPFHQWLAAVLKRIPMDGTFNQSAPLDRLAGTSGTVYSIDLKAATDRWPLLLMFEIVQSLFDRSFASSAVNSALGLNIFEISFVNRKVGKPPPAVSFIAGQPLGYYSSWPLFALSHHFVIWYAAELLYPGRKFDRYAILGDDVVIADTGVRNVYVHILEHLGVSLSVPKSLTSPTGGCEFAKKFRLYGMSYDVSPLSLKKLFNITTPFGWYNYISTLTKPIRVSTKLRLFGIGFKARSRPTSSSKHGKRVRRLLVMITHSQLTHVSFELSLATVLGFPVQPQVLGRIRDELLSFYEPKDPILPPIEAFAYPGMNDFNEFSLYHGWMKMYLDYLKWWCQIFSSSEMHLDDLINPPIYIRTWYRPISDVFTFRYGIMFRIYDRIVQLQGAHLPKCIACSHHDENSSVSCLTATEETIKMPKPRN